jgi:hypothetical protein
VPARIVCWLSLLLLCWLGMQSVHELGHVLAALCQGTPVEHVDLHPLHISRTDVAPGGKTRLVVWAGPILGSLLPVLLWRSLPWLERTVLCLFRTPADRNTAGHFEEFPQSRLAPPLRFFVGFCLIANGAYIGAGIFDPVGDALDLIHLGESPLLLAAFGACCLPAGFWVWHGAGRDLGLGPQAREIPARTAVCSLLLLGLVVVCELYWAR